MAQFKLEGAIFENNELWFDKNIPNWEAFLGQHHNRPTKYLEIGSSRGRSVCWALMNILQHKDSTATCIDPFDGAFEPEKICKHNQINYFDVFQHNIKLTQAADKVRIFKDFSANILAKLQCTPSELNSYDIIYIDGSYTSYDVLTDAIMAWPLLKQGGFLIFDDYHWRDNGKPHLEPRLAIDSFHSCFVDFIELVSKGWQVIYRKKMTSKISRVN